MTGRRVLLAASFAAGLLARALGVAASPGCFLFYIGQCERLEPPAENEYLVVDAVDRFDRAVGGTVRLLPGDERRHMLLVIEYEKTDGSSRTVEYHWPGN